MHRRRIVKGLAAAGGLAGLGTALVPVGITQIEKRQAAATRDLDRFAAAPPDAATDTAVVVFSRSGNTALATRHVARRLGASLHRLDAPQYALGLAGLAHSALDANALRTDPAKLPDIRPSTLDLKACNTVWLGSPVWFYSPAPPLWAFVARNRFDGQQVVLFNTYNSNIGARQIAAFQDQVMARGARAFKHLAVLRGRMTRQISPEQMLQSIDTAWLAAAASGAA